MPDIDYFGLGVSDARAYHGSQAYSSLTQNPKPEEAMRLFWPPVEEAMVMMSMPMPKPRQQWVDGFRKEQMVILAEREVPCPCCSRTYVEE